MKIKRKKKIIKNKIKWRGCIINTMVEWKQWTMGLRPKNSEVKNKTKTKKERGVCMNVKVWHPRPKVHGPCLLNAHHMGYVEWRSVMLSKKQPRRKRGTLGQDGKKTKMSKMRWMVGIKSGFVSPSSLKRKCNNIPKQTPNHEFRISHRYKWKKISKLAMIYYKHEISIHVR